MILSQLRRSYQEQIFSRLLTTDKSGVPSNADKDSKISVALAKGIIEASGFASKEEIKGSGQTSGKLFEEITEGFVRAAFEQLKHLRGGKFSFFLSSSIDRFEQYEHLAQLNNVLKTNRELRATLGDYIIKPDIVIGRIPIEDEEINQNVTLIETADELANLTPLRSKNSLTPILHASISCKWTIRSDRSQNARTEGLNLIRNRKGHTPHIVIVTAEPYPQRIASLALGTGDIDCVYHFALHELLVSAQMLNNEAVIDTLEILVHGKRLRDISDLPFDLVT